MRNENSSRKSSWGILYFIRNSWGNSWVTHEEKNPHEFFFCKGSLLNHNQSFLTENMSTPTVPSDKGMKVSDKCLKVSRDPFHFPWKRKFSFFSLKSRSGWDQNAKYNGVLQGKFCIFTCPKDWHFSWKMNTRMGVQNVTFRLPGSLFFDQQLACLSFNGFSTIPCGNCKKTLDLERRTVQKRNNFLLLWLET